MNNVTVVILLQIITILEDILRVLMLDSCALFKQCMVILMYSQQAKYGQNKVELGLIYVYMVDLHHLDHILTTSGQYNFQLNIHVDILTNYQC